MVKCNCMEGDKHKGFEYKYDCRCCTSGHKIKGDNKMKLNPLKSNMTEVEAVGIKILFSYKTPVAALVKEGDMWHQYKTDKKWSNTTSRHITQWNPLGGAYGLKPQEYFDQLVIGKV